MVRSNITHAPRAILKVGGLTIGAAPECTVEVNTHPNTNYLGALNPVEFSGPREIKISLKRMRLKQSYYNEVMRDSVIDISVYDRDGTLIEEFHDMRLMSATRRGGAHGQVEDDFDFVGTGKKRPNGMEKAILKIKKSYDEESV